VAGAPEVLHRRVAPPHPRGAGCCAPRPQLTDGVSAAISALSRTWPGSPSLDAKRLRSRKRRRRAWNVWHGRGRSKCECQGARRMARRTIGLQQPLKAVLPTCPSLCAACSNNPPPTHTSSVHLTSTEMELGTTLGSALRYFSYAALVAAMRSSLGRGSWWWGWEGDLRGDYAAISLCRRDAWPSKDITLPQSARRFRKAAKPTARCRLQPSRLNCSRLPTAPTCSRAPRPRGT
jgi:hypothetical protein